MQNQSQDQSQEPKPGEIYQHFKGKEKLYKVIAIARDCENPEKKIVIYKQLYDNKNNQNEFPKGTIWSRPLGDFTGEKILENGNKVKRFTLVKNKEAIKPKL